MKVLRRRLHEMANSKGKKQTEEEKTHMKKKKESDSFTQKLVEKEVSRKRKQLQGRLIAHTSKKGDGIFFFFFFDFVGMQKGLIPTRLPLCVQSVLLCKGHKSVLRRVATCKK